MWRKGAGVSLFGISGICVSGGLGSVAGGVRVSDFWGEYQVSGGEFVKFQTIGESVVGRVVGMRKLAPLREGAPGTPVLEVETESGTVPALCGNTRLASRLAALQVQIVFCVEPVGQEL